MTYPARPVNQAQGSRGIGVGSGQPVDGNSRRGTITLLAVAERAGVDVSTASRVLRDDPVVRVRPSTRSRIKTAAKDLGYVPNANARSLVLRRTMTLGLVIPSAANIVYDQIIKGAESASRAAGYVLVLTESSDLGEADAVYRELVLSGRVDGLLIGSGNLTDSLPLELFDRTGSCVILNRRIKGPYPSVIEDDEGGMTLAVEHLADLGHRRIACIAGPPNVDTARRRLRGYFQAMSDMSLPVVREFVQRTSYDEAGGYAAMLKLLKVTLPPTGVVVSSALSAIGALAACRSTGVNVPQDLSVVGFHDVPSAQYLSPPLTTVWMPLFELGARAASVLIDVISGRSVPSLLKITEPIPHIVSRDSSGPPPAVDVHKRLS